MHKRHRLIAVTFTLAMLLYIDRIAISAGKSHITGQFGLSDTEFGWALSAFALGYALFQVPAGMFADRFGPRLALALVVALWSFFTGLTGLAWSFVTLLTFRFLFGVAEAGAFPTVARAFYVWLPAGERGLAKGINLSGSRLGSAFALPVIAWLFTNLGWRETFLVLGAAGIVWALAWYWWFRDTPEEHGSIPPDECAYIAAHRGGEVKAPAPLPLGVLFRSKNVWLMMGQYFAGNFTFFFCLTWMFPYLQKLYNLDPVQAGFYSAVPLLGGALGNWVSGAVVDTLHRRGWGDRSRQYPAALGFALAAAGLLASLFCDTPGATVACLAVAVFGADMTLPPSWAFCIDIGKVYSGAVSGVMNMAGNLGSFVTSLAFPYLLAATGSTTPFFIIGALLNIISIWLWLASRSNRGIA